MTHLDKVLASFIVLFWAVATPCFATSSATSSASDSIATSVGSVSGSIQRSSASSSRPTPLAQGEYRVIEVTAAPDRPGIVRMTLQAVADPSAEGEFFLYLPQQALDGSQLSQGHIVSAQDRPYGVEFSNAATRQAFFLVLADDWYRELQTNAVTL